VTAATAWVHTPCRASARTHLVADSLATSVEPIRRAGEGESDEQSQEAVDHAVDDADAGAGVAAVFRRFTKSQPSPGLEKKEHPEEEPTGYRHRERDEADLCHMRARRVSTATRPVPLADRRTISAS
jgi:hypothetical protein